MAEHVSLTRLVGGVPFLDEGFRSSALLAAVAVVRSRESPEVELTPETARELLLPSAALTLRRRQGIHVDIPSAPLSASHAARVEAAFAELRHAAPSWNGLLDLPLTVLRLRAGEATSCSSYGVPQHVFLSDSAFTQSVELEEFLLHEICHNWMYLVEEVRVLHDPAFEVLSTLPTGTGGRNPTEVIGASHVAATLIRWYTLRGRTQDQRRIADLRVYLRGCLELLAGFPRATLTATGWEVAERLRRELQETG